MKDFEVVGYVCDGEFVCVGCFEHGEDGDAAECDGLGAVFAGSEWESYPVCPYCGEECEDVCLTAEGMRERWWRKLDRGLRASLVQLASEWHGGQGDVIYSLASAPDRISSLDAYRACVELRRVIEKAGLTSDKFERDEEIISDVFSEMPFELRH